MASEVFFAPVSEGEHRESIIRKIEDLYEAADLGSCISENDLVAIKLHFGEKGNVTHVPAEYFRPIIEKVKQKRGKPFFTDTNTLYRGQRSNSVDHMHLAHEHGFTIENTGAPVIIADGLVGTSEIEVEINGNMYSKVAIASDAIMANAFIVVAHVTGHPGTGLGAILKTLGMGLSSRKGKLNQHSKMLPEVDPDKCTACMLCIKWCPQDTIALRNEKAFVVQENCIGCGECLAVCRFGAVKFDWGNESHVLQEKIVEHAYGAVKDKEGKVGYMNFLISVTKGCDCFGSKQEPIIPDIGIIAGKDPIALDKAALDLILEKSGKELSEIAYPGVDPHIQLRHGENLGMGTMDYRFIEV